jgi:hypothetical protein
VLVKESDLDEYGYINEYPIFASYGTPETRFAYDGTTMLRRDEIQTADGDPFISNFHNLSNFLDSIISQYTICEKNADDILCYTGTDDQAAAYRIVDKLLENAGTDKKLGILWDKMTYDEAMEKAQEIVDEIAKHGYEVVPIERCEYEGDDIPEYLKTRDLVYDGSVGYSYGGNHLKCIGYTHNSIWQIKEISKAVPEETEEVVEQHEEVVENDANNEEVVEAENSIDTDDDNDTTSDNAESDKDETDDTSSI